MNAKGITDLLWVVISLYSFPYETGRVGMREVRNSL